jgi:hypothetical protein
MAPDYSPAAVCAICVLISANPRCFETKVVFAGTAARRTGVVAVVVEGGEQPHRIAAPRRKRMSHRVVLVSSKKAFSEQSADAQDSRAKQQQAAGFRRA